jgi:hypothetical protein
MSPEDGPSDPGSKTSGKAKESSWLARSLRNPDNLPHFLAAAFTLVLAVFAIAAWIESQRGTRALEGQLKEMREQQRPWVGVDIASASAKPGDTLNALVTVKNAGKSPALKVHAVFRTGLLKFNSEDGVDECHGCSESVLLPEANVNYIVPLAIPAEMAAKHPAPAIFGRVDYEDSSGNGYWTTVCRYYEIAFQLLASCSNGNAVGRK